MPANLASALSFIVGSLAQLYLFVLILRLLLPWFRADFHNPIAQAILKVTSPLVVPLRRILPPIGRIDTSTLVVALVITYLTIFVLLLIRGATASISAIAVSSVVYIILLTLRLFVFAIIVRVILSWLAPGGHNPAMAIIYSITDPLMRPFRRIIPPLGGFDLSPIFAIILISALTIIVGGFLPLPVM
jgi:YggT family protein